MKVKIQESIDIQEGVTLTVAKGIVTAKGPKGEVSKNCYHPEIQLEIADNKLNITCERATKREKKIIRTFFAHTNNLMKGVTEPYVYKLKVCSGHFPMTASVSGTEFVLKNFIGESKPRKLKIKDGIKVEVAAADITVTSVDKELAGQFAGNLEKLTKRPNFDNRIFQDGIYIVSKDGKEL